MAALCANNGQSCCDSGSFSSFIMHLSNTVRNDHILICTENCEWEDRFGPCSRECGGGERVKYPVITKHAKGGGSCPDNVLNNQTEKVGCNNEPCRKCTDIICESVTTV